MQLLMHMQLKLRNKLLVLYLIVCLLFFYLFSRFDTLKNSSDVPGIGFVDSETYLCNDADMQFWKEEEFLPSLDRWSVYSQKLILWKILIDAVERIFEFLFFNGMVLKEYSVYRIETAGHSFIVRCDCVSLRSSSQFHAFH